MRLAAFTTLASIALISACGSVTDFPVRQGAVSRAAEDLGKPVRVVPLTAENVAAMSSYFAPRPPSTNLPGSNDWVYLVGRGDVLDVVVWDHVELNNPGGGERSPEEGGHRVRSDGTFFYPYVGQIKAQGRTIEEIRSELSEELKRFIPDPQVVVRLAAPGSQHVSVTGAVGNPQRQTLSEQPLSLLDAIDGAGGLDESADPSRVTVRRGGRIFNVDLQSFLDEGLSSGNPILRDGDVINVPKLIPLEAYLLGQVVKPSTIDLTDERVTLTQAITRVGGLREERADARGVFVFRNAGASVEVYQLDASNPAAFLIGTSFDLRPQDVIYVTTAPVSKWNQVISNLLPSVNSIGSIRDLKD